jgi:hypothetical protein
MGRKKKVEQERDDIAPGLVVKTKKRLVVASGSSHPDLAQAVAAQLETELVPTEHRTFASGRSSPASRSRSAAATSSSSSRSDRRSTSG